MKALQIKSKKHGIHVMLIDDEDYERVSNLNWTLVVTLRCPHLKYAKNHNGVLLHRFILGIGKGQRLKEHVDHKDGNGLNCQKDNIRLCSEADNHKNRITPKNSTTGYKGVYLRKEAKYTIRKYTARLMVNGKRIEIGAYLTAKEAASAYNEAALKYHGEFCKLNLI